MKQYINRSHILTAEITHWYTNIFISATGPAEIIPQDQRFVGQNPAEVDGFFMA